MTTFVDPLGIVSTGTTGITTLAASAGTPYNEIPHDAAWMVAVISGTGHVLLPPGSNVGDIVEVYPTGGTVTCHGQSGESVVTTGEVDNIVGCFFRKISSTQWAMKSKTASASAPHHAILAEAGNELKAIEDALNLQWARTT